MKKLGVLAVGAFAALLGAVWWFSDPLPEPVTVTLTGGPAPPRIAPEEAGIDRVALDEAATYAGERNTRALVVAHNGHIVFEKYWGDTNYDTPVELSGFVPVLVALAAGSAVEDRLIPGLEQPMSNYVPGFAEGPSGKKSLKELLSHDVADDMGWSANLAAEALERLTKQGYETVVAERLWKPMEGGTFSMARRSAEGPGAVRASCCMTARLGDWMRVGELLSRHGVFEGNELVPPDFVTKMFTPVAKDAKRGWLVHVGGEFAAHDTVWLESEGEQRLWVIPSRELVILRVGDAPSKDRGWTEAMIPDSVVRGMSALREGQAGQDVDPNRFAPH
ncbi:MAG TPA: hypothetical protein VMF52_08650 [Steroidobacteraceae bacterium]|nr:hypothetical protein [Steroidobacteraceae bacterium]